MQGAEVGPDATPAEAGDTAAPAAPSRALTDSFKSLGLGTSILVFSTVCLFLFNFIGRVAAARALPVPVWGEFSLGVSFVSLLSVLILLGLNQAVARSIAYEKDAAEQRAIARWAILVSGIASAAASVLVFFFASSIAALFHDPSLVGVFQLLAASVGFGAITPVFAGIFQGFRDVVPNALFNQVLSPALFMVFVLFLLHAGWGLTGALVAYVAANAACFLGIVIYYWRRIGKHLPRGGPIHRRPNPRLWRFSVALWGVASLSFITGYADTLILGAYWPSVQVGLYSTAMTLARVVLLGGGALTFIFLPVSSRLAREGEIGALRVTYVTAARWILILSVPLFLLFVLAPRATIEEIFGAKYGPAWIALQILCVTAFLSTLVGPVNACLAGLGRARTQMATSLTSAAVNLVLSFSLIPFYGLLGAAIAWGIARALYPVVGLVVLYRGYGIHPFRQILLRPLALTFAVAGPAIALFNFLPVPRWDIFPLFFVAAGVFLASLVVTRSLVKGDLLLVDTLERVFRRRLPRLRSYVEDHMAKGGPLGTTSA